MCWIITRVRILIRFRSPYSFLDVTRVENGPQTFTRQDHEKVVAGPDPMIMIPPRY